MLLGEAAVRRFFLLRRRGQFDALPALLKCPYPTKPQIVSMSDTPTQRYVPGGPPPVPASKASKKKRKTGKGSRSEDSPALSSVAIPDSTPLIEKTPDASDVRDGPVVDSLPADSHSTNGLSGQPAVDEAKHSPIVDLMQKRIKNTSKKIVRFFFLDREPTKMALSLTHSRSIGSNTRLCYTRR